MNNDNNTFMPEFFPTPPNIISKMLEPYSNELHHSSILEPSAGNGAILDYISEKQRSWVGYEKSKDNLWAIESDPDLVLSLQGKGYKVISNDFLTYTPSHDFRLIVMNPPFSNGDAHLLRAWEILSEGDIVCLLNAETISNPYTAKRQLLQKIIANNGSVEMLGQCFKDAARKTNVEVALVRLHKKDDCNRWKIDFEVSSTVETPEFEINTAESTSIANNDQVGSYLRAWELTKDAAVEYVKAKQKLDFYASTFIKPEGVTNTINKIMDDERIKDGKMQKAYNSFIDFAQHTAWGSIIDKLGMDKYMTSGLHNNFNKFRSQQGAYNLNKENIVSLVQFICLNTRNIMKQAVVEVYDTFCKYFPDNAVHTEGWKTNSQFKVNRKIILPNAVELGWSGYYSTGWGNGNIYRDVDKVMCWLSGLRYEDMDKLPEGYRPNRFLPDHHAYTNKTIESTVRCIKIGDKNWHESHFFRVRAFKKGTLHLEFKDESLWAKFNLMVNQGKMEIGDNERRN